MKLLYKINRQFIIFSSIIVVLGACVIYVLVRSYSNEEAIENLYLLKQQAIHNIEYGKNAGFYPAVEIDTISAAEAKDIKEAISDTLLHLKYLHERERFLQLTGSFIQDGIGYKIITRNTNINDEDIFFSVAVPVLGLLVLILLSSFFVIYKINYSIWKPFYQNILKLKKFSAADNTELNLLKYDIEEFTDLNNCLMELTEKIRKDYQNLKIFSENISHELQTPLAIIKTKTELMLQDASLNNDIIKQIQIINHTAHRLSKLNSALILLIKIESADYTWKKKINLKNFILNKIEEIKELSDLAGIAISAEFKNDPVIEINEYLLDILFSNLIANAVKHNIKDGFIEIILTDNSLRIKNSGKEISIDPSIYFERFVKGEHSKGSTGLGLTIIKQICDINKYKISYTYEKKCHLIKIDFNLFQL